eukprot:scaffold2516_cov108-Isochrysis_galbana.AAC.5
MHVRHDLSAWCFGSAASRCSVCDVEDMPRDATLQSLNLFSLPSAPSECRVLLSSRVSVAWAAFVSCLLLSCVRNSGIDDRWHAMSPEQKRR